MEPHGSPRLLLVLLCIAISIAGGRSRLLPDVSLTAGEPAASPSRSKDFSLEGIEVVLSTSPEHSAAAEEAAALVEDIEAQELVDDINLSAALDSIDDKTLKSLGISV